MLIWSLSDGKAGHAIQALALAKALSTSSDAVVLEKTTSSFSARHLPAFLITRNWIDPEKLCQDCTAPMPDLVVSCGSRASSAALAIKSRYGSHIVNILRPAYSPSNFDAIVVPNHDKLTGKNIVGCSGALVEMNTMERLRRLKKEGKFATLNGSKIALLIGGGNKVFKFDREVCRRLADDLNVAARKAGATVIAVTSRRSPPETVDILREYLDSDDYIWNHEEENPYWDAIAVADAIVVTGDSVNMICEACVKGCPVWIYKLPLRGWHSLGKFGHFYAELVEKGHVRIFSGQLENWVSNPLDEMPRVVSEVRKFLVC